VLLDLQMPDLDGFGVIAEIGSAMPLTIFVTAYDEFALRAFEVHAFDYLLKPFGRDRFLQALGRARAHLAEKQDEQLARRFVSLVEHAGASDVPSPVPDRLVVKSGGRVVLLPLDELDAVESAGNYVRLYSGSQAHLVRETMANLEGRLPPESVLRIHRTWIVNLARVKMTAMRPSGEPELVMFGRTALRVGRAYRDSVMARLVKCEVRSAKCEVDGQWANSNDMPSPPGQLLRDLPSHNAENAEPLFSSPQRSFLALPSGCGTTTFGIERSTTPSLRSNPFGH
jgi:two-component system LytT family response regulator